MSVNTLVNPVTRLGLLPEMMNWRGVWSASEQYYKSDVVSSPIDDLSYVLDLSTLLGGSDPSASGDWIVLSPQTGVSSITAGTGISITGPATAPTINSTVVAGVTSVTAGNGIIVGGTATVPIISDNVVFLDNTSGSIPTTRLVWGTTYIVYLQTTGSVTTMRFIMPSSDITTTGAQQCILKFQNGVTSTNAPLWVISTGGATQGVSAGLVDNTLTTCTITPYINGATKQWRIAYEGVPPYQQQITMANT